MSSLNTSRIPTRKETNNTLCCTDRNKTFSSKASSVLKDKNVRSSSLEPDIKRGLHRPLKMLKSDDSISYNDTRSLVDIEIKKLNENETDEKIDIGQVFIQFLKHSSFTVQELIKWLTSLIIIDKDREDTSLRYSTTDSLTPPLINLWIENILLKSQLTIQQETGTCSNPVISSLPFSKDSKTTCNSTTNTNNIPASFSPSHSSNTTTTTSMEDSNKKTIILHTINDNSGSDIDKETQTFFTISSCLNSNSLLNQSSQTDPSFSLSMTQNEYTQTEPVSHSSFSLITTVEQSSQTDNQTQVDSTSLSLETSHLQQRLEAITISKELLSASLNDAKRQIASLEKTVADQKQDLFNKESQLTSISNRVSTLMKSFESTQSDSLQYKTLYYRSVQQCTMLQEQLDETNVIFNKLETFIKLQNKVSGQVTRNRTQLDKWSCDLVAWETNYIQMKHQLTLLQSNQNSLQKDYEYLLETNNTLQSSVNDFQQELAKQLSHSVISSVKEKLRVEEIGTLQEIIMKQKGESKELHGKIAQLVDTFQRSHREFEETAEFAEIERQTLLEANVELERDVKLLRKELEKGEEEFKKLVTFTKDYQAKSTQKAELLKFNVSKADTEIEELDRLLELTRKVLHDNMSVVSGCDPLLTLMKELDGDNNNI